MEIDEALEDLSAPSLDHFEIWRLQFADISTRHNKQKVCWREMRTVAISMGRRSFPLQDAKHTHTKDKKKIAYSLSVPEVISSVIKMNSVLLYQQS